MYKLERRINDQISGVSGLNVIKFHNFPLNIFFPLDIFSFSKPPLRLWPKNNGQMIIHSYFLLCCFMKNFFKSYRFSMTFYDFHTNFKGFCSL